MIFTKLLTFSLRLLVLNLIVFFQLPAAAQWGASGGSQSSAPSLSQIQQLEAENDRIEQADVCDQF